MKILTTAQITKVVKDVIAEHKAIIWSTYNDKLANNRRKLKYVVSYEIAYYETDNSVLDALARKLRGSNIESIGFEKDFLKIVKIG